MKVVSDSKPFVRLQGRDGDPLFAQVVDGGVAITVDSGTDDRAYTAELDPPEWGKVLDVVRAVLARRIRGSHEKPQPATFESGSWVFSAAYTNWGDHYAQGVCFRIHTADYKSYAGASIEYEYLDPLLSIAPERSK